MLNKIKQKPVCRVLVVEDSIAREDLFKSWLPPDIMMNIAKSAGAAIGTLKRDAGKVYAGIMLDYDLQGRCATHMDQFLSGTNVCSAVIQHVDRDVPILVHSMNPSGARTMIERLEEAGFTSVTRIAMEMLNKEAFISWIEEVRNDWNNWLDSQD